MDAAEFYRSQFPDGAPWEELPESWREAWTGLAILSEPTQPLTPIDPVAGDGRQSAPIGSLEP